ncbi:hypothetical protein POTOM_062196 [Populus tomentosa]|uniref:Uncharacterized protein n=1 Tax=Populus tomentosa TaxID=118781 RepID=A0A8X7XX50_POPTO|nr:hypothetical protein POTOM_062196 [Populus tomentosa]
MYSCINTRVIHVCAYGLCFCLSEGCPLYGNTPIFRTGSGKPVALKQSSIAKALAVLGGCEDGEAYGGDNEFGPGKSVVLRQSLIAKAMSVQQFVWKPSTVEQFVWQDLSHSGMKAGMRNNGVIGDDLLVNTDLLQPEAQYSAPKPPPFKFHTAGGRSFSVSSEALKRARSLPGDPDIGAFLNEGDAFDMGLSVFEDIIFDEASSNKENSFYSAFTHPEASKKLLRNGLFSLDTTDANSLDSGTGSRMNPLQWLLRVLLFGSPLFFDYAMNLTSLRLCCPWERFIQLLCNRNSVSVIDTAISPLDSESRPYGFILTDNRNSTESTDAEKDGILLICAALPRFEQLKFQEKSVDDINHATKS